ncbi:MAG: ribonuclease III [Candidatus Marinimicrobia bacterium]|nr:ribonuclease III [Candidatus Neomarinimicrobiota bacterium]
MKKNLDQIEKKLGIKWHNPQLLAQALVHRSYLNEVGGESLASNERLEFLGDAVLSFTVSHWLYTQFPDYQEGELTNLRSNLVRTSTLAQISQELDLGEKLLMSRGEVASGGRENPSLLANTLEAVIGAIFLDQGIDQTILFIKTHLTPFLEKIVSLGEFKDSKSLLQDKIQEKNKETPIYKTLEEIGPDHDKTFTVGVYAQGQFLAQAQGKNKQEAEEKAAKNALEKSGLKS